MSTKDAAPLFRALLKHWRASRGMSQLDLAGAAEVSARHISFLETGRAQPSQDMVLRLARTLGLALREQNSLLSAAGFAPAFPDRSLNAELDPSIEAVLTRMLEQQEPYPLLIMNRRHDILRMNRSATILMTRFVARPDKLAPPFNAIAGLFDPDKLRPFVLDWERLARHLLTYIQREALARPGDESLRELALELCRFPDVPSDWYTPDLSISLGATLPVRFARDGVRLSFITTLTVFNAPQDVALEDLRIESFYPADRETERLCAELTRPR